jgi:hypothetical protein
MNIEDLKSIELRTMIEHFNQQMAAIYALMNATAYLVSVERNEQPDKIFNDMKNVTHTIYAMLNKAYPSGLIKQTATGKPGENGIFPPFPDELFPPYTMN